MTNGCSTDLISQLDGAKITRSDTERGLILAWFGGHGVHAYDGCGEEVSFWNVGDFAKNDADEEDVVSSMEETIERGDYP